MFYSEKIKEIDRKLDKISKSIDLIAAVVLRGQSTQFKKSGRRRTKKLYRPRKTSSSSRIHDFMNDHLARTTAEVCKSLGVSHGCASGFFSRGVKIGAYIRVAPRTYKRV